MSQTTFFATPHVFHKSKCHFLSANFEHMYISLYNQIFVVQVFFLHVREKHWQESTLQGNSKNQKIKMLFKTENQNWNLNYLERLSF